MASGYNFDIKNPNTIVADHEDPDELLTQYVEVVTAVAAAQNALRAGLAESLERR